MRKNIFILLFLGCAATATAQQLQTSSMYDLQGIFHNPSTAGVGQSMVGASYRTQWSNISGAPRTATVFGSFDMPDLKIGIGGYLYSDKTGPTSRTGLQLSFAPMAGSAPSVSVNFALSMEYCSPFASIPNEKMPPFFIVICLANAS